MHRDRADRLANLGAGGNGCDQQSGAERQTNRKTCHCSSLAPDNCADCSPAGHFSRAGESPGRRRDEIVIGLSRRMWKEGAHEGTPVSGAVASYCRPKARRSRAEGAE
jgi:hypothetical protein